MGILSRIWNLLGSRDLSVFIFIMGLTYFLFLVAFGFVVPGWWVNNISKLLPFKVLYVLFFINLLICEIKWIPVVVRRCRRPGIPLDEEDMKRFRHSIQVKSEESEVRRFEKYLRWRGYKVKSGVRSQESGVGSPEPEAPVASRRLPVTLLHAYKGRFSPIGNLLFHLSFLFVLAGVFVSISYRTDSGVLLMEGQDSLSSGLKIPAFEVVNIKPKFWNEKLLFTELVARLKHEGYETEARLSSGANIDGAQITISGISYTPGYILKDMDGRELDVGYVNLANFVPGSTDNFQIPDFPYKIYVSIFPDFEIKENNAWTRSLNLVNPRLLVRIVRGKITVYAGLLRLKDEARFDGLALSFPEIKYNGSFRIIRDPGNNLIWAGFILMGLGLAWKLVFYKKEAAVIADGDDIHLYVNSDYYHNLFMEKCLRLIKS